MLEHNSGFIFAPQWMRVVGGFHWSSLPCAVCVWVHDSALTYAQGRTLNQLIVSADFPWVCFRWQTCLISKAFSHGSNILPSLHHCKWEETQVFVLKFSAWVHRAESSVFTKWVVFKRYRDQNRTDVTHSADKQLEKVNNTQIFWAF